MAIQVLSWSSEKTAKAQIMRLDLLAGEMNEISNMLGCFLRAKMLEVIGL